MPSYRHKALSVIICIIIDIRIACMDICPGQDVELSVETVDVVWQGDLFIHSL